MPKHISNLSDLNMTPNDIEEALGELDPSAFFGPDGWPAFLLHKFRAHYAKPLYLLWRRSLDTGLMPEGINLAFIAALFKGGDKSLAKNYRPISLTSHITKTFERVLR